LKAAPLILVFGISGSGKSHLAKKIARARPAILRLTASSLLKSWFHTTGERLRTANRDTVVANQSALRDALANARKDNWDRPVALEAHAVIDNDEGIVDVPIDTFKGLGVSYVLFVSAPVDVIAERRKKDRRHRPERRTHELDKQQIRSLSVSRLIAEELSVPFAVIESVDFAKALRVIDSVCRDQVEL
jgi:adenylate kinase